MIVSYISCVSLSSGSCKFHTVAILSRNRTISLPPLNLTPLFEIILPCLSRCLADSPRRPAQACDLRSRAIHLTSPHPLLCLLWLNLSIKKAAFDRKTWRIRNKKSQIRRKSRDPPSTAIFLHCDPGVRITGASTTTTIAARTSQRATTPSMRMTLPLLLAGSLSRKTTRILPTIPVSCTTTIHTTTTLTKAHLRHRTVLLRHEPVQYVVVRHQTVLHRHEPVQYAVVRHTLAGDQMPQPPHRLREDHECPSKPQVPQAPTFVSKSR
jgi:hypothetical protein